MKKNIWLEWIGIWGSGKSTAIKKLQKQVEETGRKVASAKEILDKDRKDKLHLLLKLPSKFYLLWFKLIFYLTPTMLLALITRDSIRWDEIKSFFRCFLARLASVQQNSDEVTLWEGEFHLIPIFGMTRWSMERIVNIFIKLHESRKPVVVFINIDIDLAYARILEDQSTGATIRFDKRQRDSVYFYLKAFYYKQEIFIDVLRDRGFMIFEMDDEEGKLLSEIKLWNKK